MKLFKSLILAATLLILPLLSYGIAADYSYSSYEKIADAQIVPNSGAVCSILIMTDGTNDAKVILYDVSAAGDIAVTNKISEITVVGADNYGGRAWPYPVRFSNGLYADVTGTGASYIIEWIR